jgi:hypothetical protein
MGGAVIRDWVKIRSYHAVRILDRDQTWPEDDPSIDHSEMSADPA